MKTSVRLITYFDNFVFSTLVIYDDQNHLLCLFKVQTFWETQNFKKIFLRVLDNQLIYFVNVNTMRKIFFKLYLLLKKSELYLLILQSKTSKTDFFRNKQNHATIVTKIQKKKMKLRKLHEPNKSRIKIKSPIQETF